MIIGTLPAGLSVINKYVSAGYNYCGQWLIKTSTKSRPPMEIVHLIDIYESKSIIRQSHVLGVVMVVVVGRVTFKLTLP